MKQIFKDTKVTKRDERDLGGYLKSWPALNEAFLLIDFTPADIEKMITLEFNGHRRAHILKKLVGRWGTLKRKSIYNKLGI